LISENIIYDELTKEEIFLTFLKKTTFVDAMHVTCEEGRNVILLPDSEEIVTIDPADLENIDQITPDIFRYYFTGNAQQVSDKYKELSKRLKQEDIPFNMQEAVDSILQFLQGDDSDAPMAETLRTKLCLGNATATELLLKLFGEKIKHTEAGREMMMMYSLVWLHGYMISNLMRKKEVRVVLNKKPITQEELDKHLKELDDDTNTEQN